MKFIDFFAGIGGFRRGMELAGHECVGFCEFDKFAVASYTSMHLITDEQREYLSTLDLKQRQKEILKEEYRNGEWFANDVRRIFADDLPEADCWCFGFPCQDISVAGKQLGFTGNRSSLFFRVMRLLRDLPEEKKPTWLFVENVKNLLSVNGGWDFARVLVEMDGGGTTQNGKCLTAKTSESHRTASGCSLSDILEVEVDQKYFLSKEQTERIIFMESDTEKDTGETPRSSTRKASLKPSTQDKGGGRGHHTIEVMGVTRPSAVADRTRILSGGGISQSLRATDYKDPVKVGLSVSEIRTLPGMG